MCVGIAKIAKETIREIFETGRDRRALRFARLEFIPRINRRRIFDRGKRRRKARGGSAEVKERRIARARESGSAESGRVGVEFEPWLVRQGT